LQRERRDKPRVVAKTATERTALRENNRAGRSWIIQQTYFLEAGYFHTSM
jgi:hypothetical protein